MLFTDQRSVSDATHVCTMVHSTFAQGHVMGGREPGLLHGAGVSLGTGIPKSPSFHSGLDLAASASVDSLSGALNSITPTNSTMVITPTEQMVTSPYQYQSRGFSTTTPTTPMGRVQKNGGMNSHITMPLPNLTGYLLNLEIITIIHFLFF